MIDYRQWHEVEGPNFQFFTENQVYFCQCDAHHRLSLFELLRMVTDAAVEDFNQRIMSYDVLSERGLGILVSRQSFRFHSMPRANQKITIRTWEEKPEALQFVRAYEIFDTDTREPLVSGLSTWLLVDLNKRRMMRIRDFTLREEPTVQTEHDCLRPEKIPLPEDLKPILKRPIWYSDIDGNGHMNNARYGAFVVDLLPPEFQSKVFTDFKINYSREAVQGQMIELFASFSEQEGKVTVVGRQEDSVCFEAELFYRP